MNCVAVDDEPLALEVMKKYISKAPELHLSAVFSDAIEAKDYLQKNQVALLFLDIQMPDINGIQLYQGLTVKPMVIFTTAYKEFAIDGFDADAIDYLLKPFDFSRFQKGVDKAILSQKIMAQNDKEYVKEFLYIHSDYKVIKIPCKDIIFIEALDDYAKINTISQSYFTLLSLKAVLEKLPKDQFIRIHRSYIIALQQITFIQFRKLGMLNGIELPLGDTYRHEILGLKKQGLSLKIKAPINKNKTDI